jgi:hypothetical protein
MGFNSAFKGLMKLPINDKDHTKRKQFGKPLKDLNVIPLVYLKL